MLPTIRGHLLDLGCGTNELARRYGEGVGVDVYQFGGVDVLVGDSAQLPFEDEIFDTVSIVAALNHIPNRRQTLREVRRVLRSNGRVVVTMIPPTISTAWHMLRRKWDADQTLRGMKPGEVYGLRRAEVRTLLKEADFEIIEEKAFMFGINRLTVARKVAAAS
ncbi:MAG: class I SAM-dependent methyltransferase [Acidobacteriota bacterium]